MHQLRLISMMHKLSIITFFIINSYISPSWGVSQTVSKEIFHRLLNNVKSTHQRMSNGLRPTAEFYLLVRVGFNLYNHVLYGRAKHTRNQERV